jgi:hypothetical protein
MRYRAKIDSSDSPLGLLDANGCSPLEFGILVVSESSDPCAILLPGLLASPDRDEGVVGGLNVGLIGVDGVSGDDGAGIVGLSFSSGLPGGGSSLSIFR